MILFKEVETNMKNLEESEKELKEIEKLVKPSIMMLIITTLVYISPYGHLILAIITKDYDYLLLLTLLVFPTLILLTLHWNWYIDSIKKYKKVARDIYKDLNRD